MTAFSIVDTVFLTIIMMFCIKICLMFTKNISAGITELISFCIFLCISQISGKSYQFVQT